MQFGPPSFSTLHRGGDNLGKSPQQLASMGWQPCDKSRLGCSRPESSRWIAWRTSLSGALLWLWQLRSWLEKVETIEWSPTILLISKFRGLRHRSTRSLSRSQVLLLDLGEVLWWRLSVLSTEVEDQAQESSLGKIWLGWWSGWQWSGQTRCLEEVVVSGSLRSASSHLLHCARTCSDIIAANSPGHLLLGPFDPSWEMPNCSDMGWCLTVCTVWEGEREELEIPVCEVLGTGWSCALWGGEDAKLGEPWDGCLWCCAEISGVLSVTQIST